MFFLAIFLACSSAFRIDSVAVAIPGFVGGTPWEYSSLPPITDAADITAVGAGSVLASACARLYESVISPADGKRCPMYPSCSKYAALALSRHGWIEGILMTCDRLIRCGSDMKQYEPVNVHDWILRIDLPKDGND